MQKEKLNLLITSAGTASAVSVIKALKSQNYFHIHIIALDNDKLAPGLFLADDFRIVPKVTSPDYIETLIRIAQETKSKVLIPIYSKEIALVASNSKYFAENGISTFLSDVRTIELCNNKVEMLKVVSGLNIQVPYTFSKQELELIPSNKFPLFAKPIQGSSSAGIKIVENKSQLANLLSDESMLFQEYIQADEVTVDVLCNKKSEPIVVAPRYRIATKSGQSIKAKTTEREMFLQPIRSVCKELNIKGVCNFQFFVEGEKLTFIEVNPRFAAGGLMLTVRAGANIPLLLLKMINDIQINEDECIAKSGVFMTRYWEEIFVDELQKKL